MKYIVYLSTAVNLMTADELTAILQVARKNNINRDITGVLLYSQGTFVQVLEGPEEAVDRTFLTIELDRRHKNIIKLIDKSTQERNFPDWSMGFTPVTPGKLKELEGFLQSTDDLMNSENPHATITVLKTFIKTNQLAIDN